MLIWTWNSDVIHFFLTLNFIAYENISQNNLSTAVPQFLYEKSLEEAIQLEVGKRVLNQVI